MNLFLKEIVYCMGQDSGGPAQHVLEVKFFMIMHFYIKPFKAMDDVRLKN